MAKGQNSFFLKRKFDARFRGVGRGVVGKDTIKSRLFKEMYFRFCIYSDKCTNTQSSIIVFLTR